MEEQMAKCGHCATLVPEGEAELRPTYIGYHLLCRECADREDAYERWGTDPASRV